MHDFSKPIGSDRNPMVESGVTIISRDACYGEINLMKGTIRVLPRDVRDSIRKVIHDAIYEQDREIAENVACQIAQRFVLFAGGFNDIYVKWEGIELAHRGPEWDQERLAFLHAKSEATA
jgi:hypothetical protein